MKKWVKRTAYFLGGLVILIILFILFLQTNYAKRLIRDKAQAYLSQKTHSTVIIGAVDFSLPTWVELKNVLWLDLNKDTLVYGQQLKVDIAMFKLIKGKFDINKIELNDVYVNLSRQMKDSVFNYQFIADAFKSKTPQPKKDTSSLDLSLNKIVLSKVRFNMLDYNAGSFIRFTVDSFEVKMKDIDLAKQHYSVNNLYADKLFFSMDVQKRDTSVSTAKPFPLVNIKNITIKNSVVNYDNKPDGMTSHNNIGLLTAANLNNEKSLDFFKGKSLQLNNSTIVFQQNTNAPKPVIKNKPPKIDSIPASTMRFEMDEIAFTNNKVVYSDAAQPVKQGLDYYHLNMEGLTFNAKNNFYSGDSIQSNIAKFSFTDKSGFKLNELKGNMNMNSSRIVAKDLILKTPYTNINAQATVYPASLITNSKNKNSVPNNDIVLSRTIIGKKDLELLAGSIAKQYKKQLDVLGNIIVDAKIEGNADKLFIQRLNVNSTTANVLHVQLTGVLNNATDAKNIRYNLNIQDITASSKLISPFINSSKQQINLPPFISLKGKAIGNMNNVDADIVTNSAYGVAALKGKIYQFSNIKNISYDVVVTTNNFETGKWVNQDSLLGKITGTVAAKGSNGFDIKHNNMQVNANVKSFRYQKNTINNIQLNTTLQQGLFVAKASIKDKLIQLNTNGKGNIQTDYPTTDAVINIVDADLLALGFSKDSLTVTAFSKININSSTPQTLDGSVRIDSAVIKRVGQKINIDSAIVIAKVKNDSTEFQLVSPFADANVYSTVYYNEMMPLINEVLGRLMKTDKQNTTVAKQGSIKADMNIKPNENYTAFIKNFHLDNNITVKANITNTNRDSSLKAYINIPYAQINSLSVGNMNANIIGKGDSLNAVVTADTLKQGNILLYDDLIKASYSKNNTTAFISTKDENKKEQFHLSATAQQGDNIFTAHLGEDLLLNYQKWLVTKENTIRLADEGFNIQQMDIKNKEQRILIRNENETYNSTLLFDLDDFKLSNISSIFNKDTLTAEATINAKIKISDFKNAIPTMDGYFEIDSLVYQKNYVGNIDVEAKTINGAVTVTGKMDGNENNVDLSGSYNQNNINVKINLNPLAVASVQPFTANNLMRSSGFVYGPINITGAADNPQWNGELRFDKVQTTVSQYGTLVKIDNQKINFTYPTITFTDFTVKDSANNSLTLDGNITKDANNNFTSDVDVSATNFNVLNSNATVNGILYGNAIVDVDANVHGTLNAPDVSGNIKLKNKTNVTYVVQNTVASAKDREGVMEFVDMDTITNLFKKNTIAEAIAALKKNNTEGSLNYNLDIEVEPQAKFNIIVDPNTRDLLQVQGNAQLNASVNPNGSVSLTGIYNLNKGSYDLHYQFLTRKFILQDSSTVTLTGNPSNAGVDISAVYEVETNAVDLIGNEVQSPSTETNYKSKVPFEVILKIKGSVTRPRLSFDIKRKENAEGIDYNTITVIDNKLTQLRSDTSAMNKQVFALLIMNRFIGEQSRDFFAGNNNNSNKNLLSNTSVSAFLAESLNQLASDLIKGVDVDINLKTVDVDPTQQHTDLSVGLSKQFLDNRLSVTVGKSFTVDGNDPSANGRNNSNDNVQFIPDVNTNYKLSKDGRYVLKVYRRSQYEAILDGYFIETGVAFSLSMDYNQLKEIFKKKKDEEAKIKKAKKSVTNK